MAGKIKAKFHHFILPEGKVSCIGRHDCFSGVALSEGHTCTCRQQLSETGLKHINVNVSSFVSGKSGFHYGFLVSPCILICDMMEA